MVSTQPMAADEAPRLPLTGGRTALGIALLVLSTAGLALLVADYLSASARLSLADAGWSLGALTAVVGITAAWRRSTRRDRMGWRLLMAAGVAWLIGQLIWDAYGTTTVPASPTLADICWLAFALISAIGIHRLGFDEWRTRRVSSLELVPLMVAVCSLVTALLWSDILHSKLSPAAIITSLACPVFYVSAVLVMLQAAVAGALDLRRNPGMAAILGGLALEALGFILWSPLLLAGTYTPGADAVDILCGAGMILIGLGAFKAGPAVPVAAFEQVSRRRGGILPSLTFATLAGFEVALPASRAPRGAELALSLGVAIVGGALIARSSILRRQQDALYAQLDYRGRQLQAANHRLSEESRRDALTGLGNRLRLHEDLGELTSRTDRYHHRYSMALIDLDHFKQYNDEHGHLAGDRALRQVAALLRGHARDGDRAYRYGGEEFLLILPEQDAPAAQAVTERHLARLQQAALPHPTSQPAGVLTFSAGVAAAVPGETPDQVLKRADEALYTAKNTGRDRVVVATSRHPTPGLVSAGLRDS